jgi:hypothetical protein
MSSPKVFLPKSVCKRSELLISFGHQAVSWFSGGGDDTKRAITNAVGLNYTLTEQELRGEAVNPFSLPAEEPTVLYKSAFLNDVRTLWECRLPPG